MFKLYKIDTPADLLSREFSKMLRSSQQKCSVRKGVQEHLSLQSTSLALQIVTLCVTFDFYCSLFQLSRAGKCKLGVGARVGGRETQIPYIRKAYAHSDKTYFALYLINSEAATIFCKIHLKYIFKLPMKKFIFT